MCVRERQSQTIMSEIRHWIAYNEILLYALDQQLKHNIESVTYTKQFERETEREYHKFLMIQKQGNNEGLQVIGVWESDSESERESDGVCVRECVCGERELV